MQSLVEIGSVILEKKISKILSMYFYYFLHYLPLKKEQGPSLEQTLIPFTQECFVSCLVEIDRVVLEKKMKIRKVYGHTDRQTTDDRRSEKLT